MENIIDKILKLTQENIIEWNAIPSSEFEEYKCYIKNIYIKAIKNNYPLNIEFELYHVNCNIMLESLCLDIEHKEHRNPEIKSKGYILYEAITNNINYHVDKYIRQSYDLIDKMILDS